MTHSRAECDHGQREPDGSNPFGTGLRSLSAAFEGMEKASSTEALRLEMKAFARRMGFDKSVYAIRTNGSAIAPGGLVLAGYPQEWVEHYVSRGYIDIDPVVRHCERSALPLIWDQTLGHTKETEDFWVEARRHGIRSGISFATREPLGTMGIFSLARDESVALDDRDLAALIGSAQMFARVLHRAVMRLELPRLLDAHKPLTLRERECLKWTAEGKTAWEIGVLIGVTERTAIFHLRNALKKLQATNKTQAVVRAMTMNLL